MVRRSRSVIYILHAYIQWLLWLDTVVLIRTFFFVIHHIITRAQLALPSTRVSSTDADKNHLQVLFEAVPNTETTV